MMWLRVSVTRASYIRSRLSVCQTINNSRLLFSHTHAVISVHSEKARFLISAEEWVPYDGCGSYVHGPFGSRISHHRSGKAVIQTDHVRGVTGERSFGIHLSLRDGQPIYAVTNNINRLPVSVRAKTFQIHQMENDIHQFATFNAISRSRNNTDR